MEQLKLECQKGHNWKSWFNFFGPVRECVDCGKKEWDTWPVKPRNSLNS